MKKLIVATFICLVANPALAVQVFNGESKTYYVSCAPAQEDVYLAAKANIHHFTDKYKAATIKNNLKQIRFCGELLLFGENWAAGTYDFKKKIIYVKTKKPYQQEYVLHHEFSSILLKSVRPRQKIKLLMGFKRNSIGGYRDFRDKNWMVRSHSFLKKGYIVPYAQTCFENDFNMMAAYYKTSFFQEQMMESNAYPRIHNKYKIIERFYKKL
jgi:hypothetical protein